MDFSCLTVQTFAHLFNGPNFRVQRIPEYIWS